MEVRERTAEETNHHSMPMPEMSRTDFLREKK
jgi:hypothetical protein